MRMRVRLSEGRSMLRHYKGKSFALVIQHEFLLRLLGRR